MGVTVLALAGSYRRDSINQKLLAAAAERAPEDVSVETFDLRRLPFYDGDVEAAGDPEPVAALKSAVREADALLFVTPEYNGGIPAVLKNGVDWISRTRPNAPIAGKRTAVIGATPGRSGTRSAQAHLRAVLARVGAQLPDLPELALGDARSALDNGGGASETVGQTLTEIMRGLAEPAAMASPTSG